MLLLGWLHLNKESEDKSADHSLHHAALWLTAVMPLGAILLVSPSHPCHSVDRSIIVLSESKFRHMLAFLNMRVVRLSNVSLFIITLSLAISIGELTICSRHRQAFKHQ